MYKKKIEQYIEAHKQEMLDDICTLCSINSERSAYQEGDPFGEGPSRALAQALLICSQNQADIFCHRDSQFFDRTHRIQSCYRRSLVIRRAGRG